MTLARGKCYQISTERSCFQDLLPLLAACAGIYAAVQVRKNRNFISKPTDGFVIACKHLDARVVLPLHGPIEDALEGKQPNAIGVGVIASRETARRPDDFNTLGFKTLFDILIQPFLTNQYERHRAELFQKYKNDRTQLPNPWQMAWLIRNGLSHNGKVHFDRERKLIHAPVSWRELVITTDHQDHPILGNFVNIGDLIVLSLDMEEVLTGPLPWQPLNEHHR